MRAFERSLADFPAPSSEALAVCARLVDQIAADIAAAGGRLRFDHYMQRALYAPGLGYYAAGSRKFGAGGDFTTAPELSPLFSRCLARASAPVLAALGGGDVLEFGAGTGTMAAGVLAELARLDCLPGRYRILDASAELRERQRATLAAKVPALLDRVEWLDALPPAGSLCGVVLGNELLDAMPVRRFRIGADGPQELYVRGDAATGFELVAGPADAGCRAAVAAIEAAVGPLAEGYESEWNPALPAWFASLGETLAAGAAILIDYGHPRRAYYHPSRARGTFLCHYRHRAHDDALVWPGLQDLTAHVDFTAVADAALAAGFEVAGYCTQAWFLFGCGLEALLAEVDPEDLPRHVEAVRQVKLLTLPGEMGERFQAIGLTKGPGLRLPAFALRDERGRL